MPRPDFRPLVLAAACVALTGCRLFGGDSGGSDVKTAPKKAAPAAIASVQDWDRLDPEVRHDVMETDYTRYKNLSLTGKTRLQDVKDPAQKAFVDKMAAYMRTNGDMNIEDQTHARIGEPETWVELLLLDGKTILGGEIRVVQLGCDMADETTPAFKTKEEAEQKGCDVSGDAWWSAHGAFNHDGVPFEYADFMEWGGP